MSTKKQSAEPVGISKALTGIDGFDDLTKGGLPQGRPSLIIGGPGSGKTLFSMEFLVKGATLFNEPGVFFTFEESENELIKNCASLGFDLATLQRQKLIAIDFVKVEADDIIETGLYDLDGLFIRLGYAIDSIGAKRVVIDTIESIFSSFSNTTILRSELRRLFQFLKDKGVTSIITGEQGDGKMTRNGLEEYVSDAVIMLDNRIVGGVATRRMRIIKYRGSGHGMNEYPFLIGENGFSILPLSALGLSAKASDRRISSGIPGLDEMMGGNGFFEASTILITGQAGTGKTSFGASFALAACKSKKKVLFISFEESPSQVIRNMGSIGIKFSPYVKKGNLRLVGYRPTSIDLEGHIVALHMMVNDFKPDVVIIDPISSLMSFNEAFEVRSTLVRMVDFLKTQGITSMFTDLKTASNPTGDSMISSLVDTWIKLEDIEANGENNRILRFVKSRGMPHSKQIREFHISDDGIELVYPYLGPAGVLTGSARYAQEMHEKADSDLMSNEIIRLNSIMTKIEREKEAQIAALEGNYEEKMADLQRALLEIEKRNEVINANKRHIESLRTTAGGGGEK